MDNQTKEPYKTDVAVLFIFFTREEQTAQVFEQIKMARPSRLYLYQDGPRPGREDDVRNIARCRQIVEQIDWQCEVHRMYQEKNYGCDPSEYISQKWMFATETKGIVLEDDDVPSQSFFPFCKELLDRYENDERINMICGMNNIDVAETDDSYVFTRHGAIWGWATWKRNVDRWDPEYKWLKNRNVVHSVTRKFDRTDGFIPICQQHLASGREHYESILASQQLVNNQLNIVPKYNMITNIGIGSESTHSVSDISKLARATRKLLHKERFEIEFPLKHPEYVVEDMRFNSQFERQMYPSHIVRFGRKLEAFIYRKVPFIARLSMKF